MEERENYKVKSGMKGLEKKIRLDEKKGNFLCIPTDDRNTSISVQRQKPHTYKMRRKNIEKKLLETSQIKMIRM